MYTRFHLRSLSAKMLLVTKYELCKKYTIISCVPNFPLRQPQAIDFIFRDIRTCIITFYLLQIRNYLILYLSFHVIL